MNRSRVCCKSLSGNSFGVNLVVYTLFPSKEVKHKLVSLYHNFNSLNNNVDLNEVSHSLPSSGVREHTDVRLEQHQVWEPVDGSADPGSGNLRKNRATHTWPINSCLSTPKPLHFQQPQSVYISDTPLHTHCPLERQKAQSGNAAKHAKTNKQSTVIQTHRLDIHHLARPGHEVLAEAR